MPKFSEKSLNNLSSCDKDLQRLFKEVVKEYDCSILCGYRDVNAQTKAYNAGNSSLRFPYSKHNKLPSEAVDVVPYPVDWKNKDDFYKFAAYVLNTAMKMNIRIKWGGFFYINGKPFFDGAHFQLIKE